MFENEVLDTDEPIEAHPDLALGTGVWDAAQAAAAQRSNETGDPQGIHVAEIEAKTAVTKGSISDSLIASMQKTTDQFIEAAMLGKSPKGRVKRTESQMIAALGGSALKEANYISDRIKKLEDKISELMGAVGQPARQLVLNDNPHLSRY